MVSELEEAWTLALAEAEQRARIAGRSDIAEYLALRNSNDLLRKTGVDWLLHTFSDFAGEANRRGAAIQLSKEDGFRFRLGTATMVGQLLTLKNGLRTLFVEAGWPRTPRDGFIRGGGLARANIRHLGLSSANEHLQLTTSDRGIPRWVVIGKHGTLSELQTTAIPRHLELLVDQK